MHAAELSSLVAGGLKASSWGRKKACAEVGGSRRERGGGGAMGNEVCKFVWAVVVQQVMPKFR